MSELGDWLTQYLTALPAHIKGSLDDARLVAAARTALHHGWTPQKAAGVVAARNYRGATNPNLHAIKRLEEIAPHPPGTPVAQRRTPHPNGCSVCHASQVCDDPVLAPIPPEWTAERWQLIRTLMAVPTADMDEDTRGQLIDDLIAKQQATWSTSG